MIDRPCFVYFIQAGEGGNIKVGISRNVQSRLSKMQTDMPVKLVLLGVIAGDERKESSLHRELAVHKVQGEWFAPHADVLATVSREKEASGNVEFLLPRKRKVARNKIHAWRLDRGLTGEQAAQLFGIHRTMLCHMEQGERFPGWETMETIYCATAGEITPNDFATFMRPAAEIKSA